MDDRTPEQRTERLIKRQLALSKKMKKQGKSILNHDKAVSRYVTDVGKHLEAWKKAQEEPVEAVVTPIRAKG